MHGKKNPLGKEWVYFTQQLTVLYQAKAGQKLKAGTWRQRLWRGTAYRLTPLGLFNLCSYTTQDYFSSDDLAHSGLDLPTSIINQENAP